MLAAVSRYNGHWVLADIMRVKSLRYESLVECWLGERPCYIHVKAHQHSAQGPSVQPLSDLALSFVTALLARHLHVPHRHSNCGFPYLVSHWEPRPWRCWIMLICCENQWMGHTRCDEFVKHNERSTIQHVSFQFIRLLLCSRVNGLSLLFSHKISGMQNATVHIMDFHWHN